jgi:hypothetical protein
MYHKYKGRIYRSKRSLKNDSKKDSDEKQSYENKKESLDNNDSYNKHESYEKQEKIQEEKHDSCDKHDKHDKHESCDKCDRYKHDKHESCDKCDRYKHDKHESCDKCDRYKYDRDDSWYKCQTSESSIECKCRENTDDYKCREITDDYKCCVITDKLARQIEKLWRNAFCDAKLLPVIGLPSNNHGVLTLTHTDGTDKLLKINGLASKSILANNALYSVECSENKFLNLYEITIPDIPGCDGRLSTAEIYIIELASQGLSVSGVNFRWLGAYIYDENREIDRGVVSVYHQAIGMNPLEFSRKTIKALENTLEVIEKRTH